MFIYKVMRTLGYNNIAKDEVEKMITEVDLNKNNLIEFSEFLKVNLNINS